MFRDVKSFYRSKEWEQLKQQLMIERVNEEGQLICNDCGISINNAYDCIGHHEIEITEENVFDYNISLNKENISLIHFKCHNKRHKRFGYDGQKKVYIVYGSPCSGKTTWVNQVADKDSLIIDIDSIWECISTQDKYNKPNRLKVNVFATLNALVDQVRTRTGMWSTCYIIGGYPLSMDRQRLADKLGAELIFINTEKEKCMERAKNNEWKLFIEDWWESFQQ
jgi:hypothetical protein